MSGGRQPQGQSHKVSGGYNGEATPVPIPNTEVKLSRADDTWLETARENRSLPEFYIKGLFRKKQPFVCVDFAFRQMG